MASKKYKGKADSKTANAPVLRRAINAEFGIERATSPIPEPPTFFGITNSSARLVASRDVDKATSGQL